jgi:hypothetical protein
MITTKESRITIRNVQALKFFILPAVVVIYVDAYA